jgi:hypothetical protein
MTLTLHHFTFDFALFFLLMRTRTVVVGRGNDMVPEKVRMRGNPVKNK